MGTRYYLAVDQDTTGTEVVLFDEKWNVAARGNYDVPVLYPRIGWAERDPEEVWRSVLLAAARALKVVGADTGDIISVGVNHEGESVVIWDKNTGKPIYNAIVWQDRRTARAADKLAINYDELVRKKTGLMIDSYFCATKYQWILDHVEGAREKMQNNELLAGTMDTWILWRMTHGQAHVTDASTASRTMLFNVGRGDWDDELLELFGIRRSMLPRICDSAGVLCRTDPDSFLGICAPVSAVLMDQQAALAGLGCVEPGMVKITYGTGSFMMMNTGPTIIESPHGLLSTVAWQLEGEKTFAVDGGAYITGGAVKWLKNTMGLCESVDETARMADSVPDNGGVYFVPAFSGLAVPHWDSYASGMMIGLSAGVKKEHIVRASLEATAYQVLDVLEVMIRDAGVKVNTIRCNGHPTRNPFLMQFQADILNMPLDIPQISCTTAFGAAFFSALGIGHFSSIRDISEMWRPALRYEPNMSRDQRDYLVYNWHRAVERAKYWVE